VDISFAPRTKATALAKRHAPLLVFGRDGEGRGENFYPMDAEVYIRSCTLYAPGPRRIIVRGRLTPEHLLHIPAENTSELYMTFAAERLMPEHVSITPLRKRRGGWSDLWDNLQDRLFDLAARSVLPAVEFLSPQRLPGFVWETALRRYRPYDIRHAHAPSPVLYYAVQVHEPYWVLHYWFFYAFNDWASGHGGHNDHEGDWESIHLFLEPQEPHRVEWLAYAAHGLADKEHVHSGDVEWFGPHPIVYVGTGTHASYFRPGVYRWKDWATGEGGVAVGPPGSQLYNWPRIPQHQRPRLYRTWRLVPLDEMAWAWHYRGFWGTHYKYRWLSALFPVLQGINGPGGPIWQAGRDRLRPQWEDPVRWARLPR